MLWLGLGATSCNPSRPRISPRRKIWRSHMLQGRLNLSFLASSGLSNVSVGKCFVLSRAQGMEKFVYLNSNRSAMWISELTPRRRYHFVLEAEYRTVVRTEFTRSSMPPRGGALLACRRRATMSVTKSNNHAQTVIWSSPVDDSCPAPQFHL